ncbi:MAG: FAD-dependent oxidoreductase [Alphaproteobacteria bacterium]|nr:MAG: FAD-dependent oxidoreductase [Alphaproteobacteria bacterium]
MPRHCPKEHPFKTPPELTAGAPPGPYRVAIIGAGPIGLAMAIDLALQGIASVVLDDNNQVSSGSRAICWAKRTLEIFDRLGIGDKMLEKGVTWKIGRLFHGEKEVYSFDLLPDDAHKMPAFVNLQQYYVEEYLLERAADFEDLIDIRWLSRVMREENREDSVTLHIETPEGDYSLNAEYAIACDGARSSIRARMGLKFEGQHFEERFLITDIEMEEPPFESAAPERWFWFRPPFHSGHSALLHKQPDNIYRIDLQLGPDADPVAEVALDRVLPRIRAIVGDRPFAVDWVSVYSFTCAMLDQFVHGRMIFAGDSAHVVSPFGARGGNGGIQDVDNLGWKLAAILKGKAGPSLLASYDEERRHGARENIKNSARATDFMTPKSDMGMIFRNEILNLAGDLPFARKLVNSGRLSVPCSLAGMALQTAAKIDAPIAPGLPCPDAPLQGGGWLLNHLGGEFVLLATGKSLPRVENIKCLPMSREEAVISLYGADLLYLIRPDQHVVGVFASDTEAGVIAGAMVRALGFAVEKEKVA